MKTFKTLMIVGALLGTTSFTTAAVINHSYAPIVARAEGEDPIEPIDTPIEGEEVQTLEDKLTELEEIIKKQANQIWNKELVSGLTIGGAIIFAMELFLVIFRTRFNKKKDIAYNDKLVALEDKMKGLVEKYEHSKEVNDEFLKKACEEMNSMKNECATMLKEIQKVIPELQQYEKFNQRLVALINILDTIAFTPENVKNGVAEKVKKLVEEVK